MQLVPKTGILPLTVTFRNFIVFFLLACSASTAAQKVITAPLSADTMRLIQIVQGNSLRHITIDSLTQMETISGNVIIKEGLTTFYCDSATLNKRTNILEAFGNIHINDNDSIHTYAQYLKYIGSERMAYLKKKVKLVDTKGGVLLTDDLDYNLRTGIATYKNGGQITNAKTILNSREGVYYSDTKDVYFKKNVHLVDPKYDIRTDSLLYNLITETATFIAPTHIVSKDGIIDTRSGTYNLKTGEAIFYERTSFQDSTHFMIADKILRDEKSNILQMEGNAKLVDSTNKVTVLGNLIYLNTKQNSFLATNKAVMILYREGDSTYITADTLFSGLKKYDSLERKMVTKADTLKKTFAINAVRADSAVRYFLAFYHVRIFNDSLQAVCDSLHYSTADSTFKLFGTPIVWNDKTQVTGDTLFMFTEKQKAKRLYVFNNGMVINHSGGSLYNQVAGRTLNAYFNNGVIDYVRVKGSPAESIFYPMDDDSAYIGMNRSSGDVIDIHFVKKELNKVKFVNNVDGILYPLKQVPDDQKHLKNFKWYDNRRPKNKLELFE